MISPEHSTAATLLLYALSAGAGMAGMVLRSSLWRRLGCGLAVAALAGQTVVLALGFHKMLPGGLSAGAYLQLMAWFVTLCGMVAWLRLRQEAPLLFAATLGLMLFVMSAPYLGTVVRVPATLSTPFYALHVGALFLSLALLALAFVAGALFLVMEVRIKSKRPLKGFWQDMPALALLDRINAAGTLAGYPLYTLGLLSGLFWAKPVFGGTVTGDPKEVVSIVVWLLFSLLFHNRLARGWKGRKPAQMAVIVFTLSLFSILVVNTLMTTHHAFLRP